MSFCSLTKGITPQNLQICLCHNNKGLWKWGKSGIRFLRPWKVWENWVGSVKVCGLQSTREKLSAYLSVRNCISHDCTVKECTSLSVLTDSVLVTVRVVPLYRMCRIVAYLRVAFLHHIAGIMLGFVKSLGMLKLFFCMNLVECYFISRNISFSRSWRC